MGWVTKTVSSRRVLCWIFPTITLIQLVGDWRCSVSIKVSTYSGAHKYVRLYCCNQMEHDWVVTPSMYSDPDLKLHVGQALGYAILLLFCHHTGTFGINLDFSSQRRQRVKTSSYNNINDSWPSGMLQAQAWKEGKGEYHTIKALCNRIYTIYSFWITAQIFLSCAPKPSSVPARMTSKIALFSNSCGCIHRCYHIVCLSMCCIPPLVFLGFNICIRVFFFISLTSCHAYSAGIHCGRMCQRNQHALRHILYLYCEVFPPNSIIILHRARYATPTFPPVVKSHWAKERSGSTWGRPRSRSTAF